MTATSESDDWESLLDSGQLDANIKKLTILQRPQTSTITAPAPVSNQINVICEDDPRAQFKPTEPVIKIMKRPDIVKQNNAQVKPKAEQKSPQTTQFLLTYPWYSMSTRQVAVFENN